MEVGDESVDDTEAVAGRDVSLRGAVVRSNASIGPGGGLQRARRRRADRHDTAPFVPRRAHGVGDAGGNRHALGGQDVILDALALDGPEGRRSDVERQRMDFDRSRA